MTDELLPPDAPAPAEPGDYPPPPPAPGAYPPPGVYGEQAPAAYAPPADDYAPPVPSAYPPPAAEYPPQAPAVYPPQAPGAYPPPQAPGAYPPPQAPGAYPPPEAPGAYPPPPPGYPAQPAAYPGTPQAPVNWDELRNDAKVAGQKSSPFKPVVPTPWMAPFLDSRGLPPGVGRFNWGALFFGFIWSLAYGLPQWAAIAFVVAFAGNQVIQRTPEPLSTILAFAQLAFQIWFAFAINKAYWAANPKMLNVDDFKRKQIKWIVIGVLVYVAIFALFFYLGLAGLV